MKYLTPEIEALSKSFSPRVFPSLIHQSPSCGIFGDITPTHSQSFRFGKEDKNKDSAPRTTNTPLIDKEIDRVVERGRD